MSTARLRKYVIDLQTLPGDVIGAWRTGGAANAWTELRRRTLDRAGGYASGLVVETDLSGLTAVPVPEGVEIVAAPGPDFSSLSHLAGDRLAGKLAAAAAAGRRCIIAKRNGRVVGFSWVSPAVVTRFESFELPLPADAIYVWQTLVEREERGTGIGSALVNYELRLARDQGYRRSWTVIRSDNTASLRTAAAVGPSRVVGTVTRLKLLSSMHSRYRELSSPRLLVRPLPA
jgi:GNAT superfamily N-acetyltransferase